MRIKTKKAMHSCWTPPEGNKMTWLDDLSNLSLSNSETVDNAVIAGIFAIVVKSILQECRIYHCVYCRKKEGICKKTYLLVVYGINRCVERKYSFISSFNNFWPIPNVYLERKYMLFVSWKLARNCHIFPKSTAPWLLKPKCTGLHHHITFFESL